MDWSAWQGEFGIEKWTSNGINRNGVCVHAMNYKAKRVLLSPRSVFYSKNIPSDLSKNMYSIKFVISHSEWKNITTSHGHGPCIPTYYMDISIVVTSCHIQTTV